MTRSARALRGITWDHPRGYAALAELERLDAAADTRYGAVPAPLTWERQPLSGFESRREESAKCGKLRGLGVTNTIERSSPPLPEAAQIRFDPTGGPP